MFLDNVPLLYEATDFFWLLATEDNSAYVILYIYL